MSAHTQVMSSTRVRYQSNQNPRRPKISLVDAPRPHSSAGVARRPVWSDNDPADADDERVVRIPVGRPRGLLERSSLAPPDSAPAHVEKWPTTVPIEVRPSEGPAVGDVGVGGSLRLRTLSSLSVGSALPDDDAPAPRPISGAKSSPYGYKFSFPPPASQRRRSRPSLKLDLSVIRLAQDDTEYSYYGVNPSARRQTSAPTHVLLGSEPFPNGSNRTISQPSRMATVKPLNVNKSPGQPNNSLANAGVVNVVVNGKNQENGKEQENGERTWSDDMLEVLECLGDGVGSICKVRDRRSGGIMVRKTILTRTVPARQLLRELQSGKLMHPNLIVHHGAYVASSLEAVDSPLEVHVLMELCEGGTLYSIARQIKTRHANARIDEKIVARLAEGVLNGLDYMHSKGVTHRDINPRNILVTRFGVVKLCNFGASRNIEGNLVKVFAGTGPYASPERIKGHAYSIQADVWSTGLTFLELVQNRLPYPSNLDPVPLLAHIADGKIPELDDDPGDENGKGIIHWSDGMKLFIKQCLCVDAATRPTPHEMLEHPWIQESMIHKVDMAKWIKQVWGWQKSAKAKRSSQDIDESTPCLSGDHHGLASELQAQKRTRVETPPGISPDRYALDSGANNDNKPRKLVSESDSATPNTGHSLEDLPGGKAPGVSRSRKKAMSTRTPVPHIPLDKQTRSEPHNAVVGSMMTSTEIASVLTDHGCVNLTPKLVLDSCSPFPISNGGSGEVYSGKLTDGTRVAIKVFRLQVPHSQCGKHLKHAAKELHTWSKCRHPNVLGLLGLVEFRGQIGMVSPWVTYGSVREYLSQHPNANRRQLCYAISDGLAYLHSIEIVHGDLKGANVLVSDDGTPLLTDFGNSVLNDQSLEFTKTTARSLVTPRWTAPEVLDGLPTLTYSADVFSLGMTLLETITGEVPYHDLKNEAAVSVAIMIKKKFPPRPKVLLPTNNERDNKLWSLLEQCWEFEAAHRPSAEKIREEMLNIVNMAGPN